MHIILPGFLVLRLPACLPGCLLDACWVRFWSAWDLVGFHIPGSYIYIYIYTALLIYIPLYLV